MALDQLKRFGNAVRSEYPNQAAREVFQGQIDLGPAEPKTIASRSTTGYIFSSADRRQAVQARLDGFTFSRFAPYEHWEALVNEARRLWHVFVDVLSPVTVKRLAVRYVNQINLPLHGGTLKFEDYLRTFPQLAGIEEDVDLEQFFLRLVMPQRDLSAKLILTEALLPPQSDALGVILDIDLFRDDVSFDVRSEEMWSILEAFRLRKNRYFEASITDAARSLFG
jgi:uncharacterized protein (TIGR04255 family)